MGVVAPQLYCDVVLLDAHLTLGLPPVHTAAAAIDAMVHAIEAYTSAHQKNPLSDALAREALRLMTRHLLNACRHGQDREAREGVLLGAMLAGQAFANARWRPFMRSLTHSAGAITCPTVSQTP